MAFSWIKGLALPVLLLTLLAACQSGPNQRGYASTSSYAPASSYPCATQRRCPPGYVLARIPIAYGGGRFCKPYYNRYSRCCAPERPPVCLGAAGPCSQNRGFQ